MLAFSEGERIALITGCFALVTTLIGVIVSIVKLIRENNQGHNTVVHKLDGLIERFDRHIEWHVGKVEPYGHLDIRDSTAESNLGRSSHSETPRSFVPHGTQESRAS